MKVVDADRLNDADRDFLNTTMATVAAAQDSKKILDYGEVAYQYNVGVCSKTYMRTSSTCLVDSAGIRNGLQREAQQNQRVDSDSLTPLLNQPQADQASKLSNLSDNQRKLLHKLDLVEWPLTIARLTSKKFKKVTLQALSVLLTGTRGGDSKEALCENLIGMLEKNRQEWMVTRQ